MEFIDNSLDRPDLKSLSRTLFSQNAFATATVDVSMSRTWKKRTASAIHAVVPDKQMAIEIIVSQIFTHYSHITVHCTLGH